MSIRTLNLLALLTLVILSVPTQLIGRAIFSIFLILYRIFGRPEGQDNIFPFGLAPELGSVIKQFLIENGILFAGIFASLWLVSMIFKKRKNDLNWKFLIGIYWFLHLILVLFFLKLDALMMILVQVNMAVLFLLAYLSIRKILQD